MSIFRPSLSGFWTDGLSSTLKAYAGATGISGANAAKIDAMLASMTSIAGVAPVALWVGGTDYNAASQLPLVIGDDFTLVGGQAASPTVGTYYARTTTGTKFFRTANPLAAESEWTECLWAWPRFLGNRNNLLATRTDATTEMGPLLYVDPTYEAKTWVTTNGNTATGVNRFPQGNGVPAMDAPRFWSVGVDSDDQQRCMFGNRWQTYQSSPTYNAHAYLRMGGVNDSTTTASKLSSAEFYVMACFDVALTQEQVARIKYTPFAAGVQAKWTTVPGMVFDGDSTTANRWNFSMHQGVQGGAWRNAVDGCNPLGVSDTDMGGDRFSQHYARKADIILTLNLMPENLRYFCYTADPVRDMTVSDPGDTTANWASIGVTENDSDGYYDKMEEFLQEIEAATGASIIFNSYVNGWGSGSIDDETATVAARAAANGWDHVDFDGCPHASYTADDTYAGIVAYGFYTDDDDGSDGNGAGNNLIHQTDAGKLLQAELFAASVAHPYDTDAPQFDGASGRPVVSGTHQDGQTLTCSTGTVLNSPTSYSYQWLKNNVAIGGATTNSYTIVTGDVGSTITCRVTANKTGEKSCSFTSAPVQLVIA